MKDEAKLTVGIVEDYLAGKKTALKACKEAGMGIRAFLSIANVYEAGRKAERDLVLKELRRMWKHAEQKLDAELRSATSKNVAWLSGTVVALQRAEDRVKKLISGVL